MWSFKGTYTGEARAYIKKRKKKQLTIFSWIYSIVILLIFAGMAIGLSDGNLTFIIIILSVGVAAIALINLTLFLYYRREPKCEIKITNDGFQVYDGDRCVSFAFYKIQTIDEYDDFIVVKDLFNKVGYVLQKELLIEGDWDDLKRFLKKVEDSLQTDNPIYQIEEPETEFMEATVKEKRIYKKFVSGVSVTTPVGLFQYFATFQLDNNEEVEYEITQAWYEKIEKEQTGTLVLVNGNFFSFGNGEDVEEIELQ